MPYRTHNNMPDRDLQKACRIGLTANAVGELPTRDLQEACQETCDLPARDMRAAHKGQTLVWHAGYLENDTEVQRISEIEAGHRSGSAESRPHGTHSECHNRTYMNMPARDMQKANQEGQTLAW